MTMPLYTHDRWLSVLVTGIDLGVADVLRLSDELGKTSLSVRGT